SNSRFEHSRSGSPALRILPGIGESQPRFSRLLCRDFRLKPASAPARPILQPASEAIEPAKILSSWQVSSQSRYSCLAATSASGKSVIKRLEIKMKSVFASRRYPFLALLFCLVTMQFFRADRAAALTGEVHMHDPSTVVRCDGRYYVFSTGRGIPIFSSNDGWTWERSGKVFDQVPESVHAVVPLNKDALVWAPDIIHHNGEYYLYYSISSWGSNVSAVGLMTNPTLNQKDARYRWTDRGLVVNSVKGENLNAIDPGVMEAPDHTLWLTYGSYIGNVQLVQLDPKTGLRIAKDSPTYILSSESEASDIIYHDGFYYLFVNRGSCCRKKDSTYNIRMGRSKTVTGPYLDPWGEDMAHG